MILENLSNEEYHASPAISKSKLDLIAKSPAHYKAAMDGQLKHNPTPSQQVGTAAHALILEPELFYQTYGVALKKSDFPHAIDDRETLVSLVQELNANRLPKLSTTGSKQELIDRLIENGTPVDDLADLDTKKAAELKAMIQELNECREGLLNTSGNRHELAALLAENGKPVFLWSDIVAEFVEANGNKVILSQDQWDALHHMRNAVMSHPSASKLLQSGKAETSMFFVDDETGLDCRIRPDFINAKNVIVDLKTAADASEAAFIRSVAKYRYHVQDAFYTDGYELTTSEPPRGFVFVVVETAPPYGVGVYELDAEAKELGRILYRQDLQKIKDCQNADKWPSYTEKIKVISLPSWEFKK